MKKLDIFILKSYIGPLIATFFVALFVLLMQFLWKYIDDLVGKGLDASVIAELMLYASAGLIPMALPLAILLASIMTFGNMGEKFELTAIKAAGISLQRAMKPLIIFSIFVSIGAFYISNVVIPYTNLKFSAILYSIKNQRPELNIKPGIFNNDLDNFSIRVQEKNPQTNMMYNFMVYEHTKGQGNTTVTLADSGSMKVTDDGRFMIVSLYDGVRYEEMMNNNTRDPKDKYPNRKDIFKTQTIIFNLSGFDFNKTDENLFKNNYQVKDIEELQTAIDSLQGNFEDRTKGFVTTLTFTNYQKFAVNPKIRIMDSINTAYKPITRNPNATSEEKLVEDSLIRTRDSIAVAKQDSTFEVFKERYYTIKPKEMTVVMDLDSLYNAMPESKKNLVFNRLREYSTEAQQQIERNSEDFISRKRTIRKYENAWHQKFTLSVACLIFFFIGAPLGAIIRKGGFGVSIVISILVFITYYMISTGGMKMSREGVWPAWRGMWLSTMVILPLGIFLTYKATVDAKLFNADAWRIAFDKILVKLKIKKEEVFDDKEISLKDIKSFEERKQLEKDLEKQEEMSKK